MPAKRRALDRTWQLCVRKDGCENGGERCLPRSDLHIARAANRKREPNRPAANHRRQSAADDRLRQAGLSMGEAIWRTNRPWHRLVGTGGAKIAAQRVRNENWPG